jgi:hypothetical protein
MMHLFLFTQNPTKLIAIIHIIAISLTVMAFYFVSTFAIAQTPTKQPVLRLSRTKNLHFAKATFPGFSAKVIPPWPHFTQNPTKLIAIIHIIAISLTVISSYQVMD